MLWRLLRTYLAPFHAQLGLVVLLQLGSTIASLYLPSINGHIIDKGVATGDTTYILVRGGMMLAIAAGQIACSFCAVYIGARVRWPRLLGPVAMAYGRDLRGGIFHHVGKLSAREVGKFGAPSLITRTTNDVQQVQMLVLMSMTMLVMAPIMCVGGIVMALRENLGLSKLLLVCIPAMAGSIGLIIGRMIPKFRIMQPKIDTVNRVLREQITGMRVVRAFVREPAEAARFAGANDDLTATALQVGKLQALMWPTVTLVFNASSVALLWFGSRRIADGSLEIGALTAYLGYLMQILVGVMMASFMSIMIPRAAVCAERIVEVLDTRPEIAPPAAPVVPAELTRMVELRGVEFRYPGAAAPVLADISFVARPGEVTAIIGSTGAGKTTMLDLIPRLSDADGRHRARRRRRRPPARARGAVGADRHGAAAVVPVHGHRRVEPPVRQPRRDRRRAVGRARARAGRGLRARDAAAAGGAHRAGRHQRLRRPAPAAGDRARAACASRPCSCSTTRSRRSISRPRRGCARRSRRGSRRRR